jgi:hypothetical protein
VKQLATTVVHGVAKAADFVTGFSSMVSDVGTIFDSNVDIWHKLGAGVDLLVNAAMDASMLVGVGELARGAELLFKGGSIWASTYWIAREAIPLPGWSRKVAAP